MKKEDARKLHPEAQEAIRLRIIAFLNSGKGTQQQAADIFQVSLPAVKKIWKKYKEGGFEAVRVKKRGPVGSTSLLSKDQVKKVTGCIKRGTPDRYGVPYFLWTANAVRLLIKKKPG
jgi:transposase